MGSAPEQLSLSVGGPFGLLPASTSVLPPWDLAVVLDGLKGPPFEPLQGADLKFVPLKTVLRLAFGFGEACQ